MQEIKRFYVGAEHIAEAVGKGKDTDNLRATLDEAVQDARSTLEEIGDVQIVVEIVAIVRFKQPPIDVEVIKPYGPERKRARVPKSRRDRKKRVR